MVDQKTTEEDATNGGLSNKKVCIYMSMRFPKFSGFIYSFKKVRGEETVNAWILFKTAVLVKKVCIS